MLLLILPGLENFVLVITPSLETQLSLFLSSNSIWDHRIPSDMAERLTNINVIIPLRVLPSWGEIQETAVTRGI
jgi:hypothetical protein